MKHDWVTMALLVAAFGAGFGLGYGYKPEPGVQWGIVSLETDRGYDCVNVNGETIIRVPSSKRGYIRTAYIHKPLTVTK